MANPVEGCDYNSGSRGSTAEWKEKAGDRERWGGFEGYSAGFVALLLDGFEVWLGKGGLLLLS